MQLHLQLGSAEASLDLLRNRVLVGRDPSCGLVGDDVSLSRRHAEILFDGGHAFIRDLGSSNGTWVNGQPVGAQPVAFVPGQPVYLGTVPLVVAWQGGAVDGGRTMAVVMPAELRALVDQRQRQQQQMMMAPPPAPAGLGVGGHVAPVPAELAYRRQGQNNNGVLLVALRGDTFSNGMVIDGYLEFTSLDTETVASITIDLVEHHKKGPHGGHAWDRTLVRQGPWRPAKGDVLPLPFQLRAPPGTSISGRDVSWELRGYVDINWAVDIETLVPITMRNTDIERIRDALGALDFRVGDIHSAPLGQHFEGSFMPPAQLAAQLGINQIKLVVEYLGANLKVVTELDKKGLFRRDREHATVFDLARFRAASLAELSANFRQQIDQMMAH